MTLADYLAGWGVFLVAYVVTFVFCTLFMFR